MNKYLTCILAVVGGLLAALLLILLFSALANQSLLNLSEVLATKPNQSKYCPDLNSTKSSNGATDSNNSQRSNLPKANELDNIISEVCAYRIAYAKYNEWLSRREQHKTASENYQSNILTIVSVVIALFALALGAGTWFFSTTIANNEAKVKAAQQELNKTQNQMDKAKQEIKKAQKKFVDFQETQQMQSDCERELLKSLRDDGFDDYIVASLMIELRIYLPLLASGDEARIKSAARFLGSYTTGYDLPKLAEYARYCRSKTPQELHYLFNFALPENEQI